MRETRMYDRTRPPITLSCPICGGELEHGELRLHKNVVYSGAGAATLGVIELRIITALLRSNGGLTTLQLAELVGSIPVNINSRIRDLRTKLKRIGWTVKNLTGRGVSGALYVIRKEENKYNEPQ